MPLVMIITQRSVPIASLCSMTFKGTKLYSILKLKCPVCQEADFFLANPYNLGKVGELHERCPVCATDFEKEPGFFTGAMYVSYAIGIAVCTSAWVAMVVLFPALGILPQILVISGIMLLGSPYFYALSKSIWANMFFRYRGNSIVGHTVRPMTRKGG